MASNNTVFANEIIENKMTELMNTYLNIHSLLTVDDSLVESAGLRKTINKYTYNGKVENLAKGAANTTKGSVSFVPAHYDVKRYQQTFLYNDIDVLTDPYLLDVAVKGAAAVMANQIADEYFTELAKITNTYNYTGETIAYNDIVDALSEIDREIETGMFIVMGASGRNAIRKDPDFIASRQGEILYTGQFGTICGLPVVYSKKVPENTVYITNKEAVRFFVKRQATVEQDKDIETKENTVVYERHGLIALVDDTASIIVSKSA